MTLPRATFDSDRSITSGARPGSGQANAIGLVPNTALRAAPRRHRARRVDEHQRDQAACRQPLDRMARPRRSGSNGGSPRRRCPGCARPSGSAASASSIAGKAKPWPRRRRSGRAAAASRPAPRGRRPCRTLACAAYIGTRDRPWPLRPSASAATSARATLRGIVGAGAAARQRAHHQLVRLSERRHRHRLSVELPRAAKVEGAAQADHRPADLRRRDGGAEHHAGRVCVESRAECRAADRAPWRRWRAR